MAEKRRLWSQEELIVVFNLYLKMPFGQMSSTNNRVKEMAKLIDRSPSAIAMRLVNFAAVDPFHINRGVSGLKGGARQTQPIFDMYISDKENFTYKSEQMLAKLEGTTIESKFEKEIEFLDHLEGKTKERVVKTRVNQNIFRKIVLNNYNEKCAVSSIDIPQLLVASHIVPWAEDQNNRMNPSNGITLNNLYDKAFDKHFISFDREYRLILSSKLKNSDNEYINKNFKKIEGRKLTLPDRFVPDSQFLQIHRDKLAT